MKKSLLILITILFAHLLYGQSLHTESKLNEPLKTSGLSGQDPNPMFLLMIDSKSIKPGNYPVDEINTKWIESMFVLTDAKSKQVYGSKNNVVLIYIKKKYSKKMMKEIRKKNMELDP